MSRYVVVYVTAPPRAAPQLSRRLIKDRVAACVNIVAGVRSIYRWKGKTESGKEALLVIKTTRDRLPSLTASVRAAHPYSVPEIIAVPIASGFRPYLEWIHAETRSAKGARRRR